MRGSQRHASARRDSPAGAQRKLDAEDLDRLDLGQPPLLGECRLVLTDLHTARQRGEAAPEVKQIMDLFPRVGLVKQKFVLGH